MELFHPPRRIPEPPQEIRQKLERLLVRMLREHAQQTYPSSGSDEEVDNE
jgi:hypothetical protein